MAEKITLLIVGLVFVTFSVFALQYLRREYRLRGKLSGLGVLVHVMMFVVHGMFVGILVWGSLRMPAMNGLPWLGIPLMIMGLGIVVYAMDLFRNFSRWLGNATPGLKTSGLYALSRNPQFLGYGLLLLGVVIAWSNLLGWIGLLSYLVLAYFVTCIEEEHLTRAYGQSYRNYCARVPRFIGWLKKRNEVQDH